MLRVFTHSRCLQHRPPAGYPETPDRLASILAGLRDRQHEIVDALADFQTAEEAVRAVHDLVYLARFKLTVDRGAPLLDTGDNPIVDDTWDAAWAAVQVTLAAADWLVGAPGRKPFAAVRPPGHHAERAMAMGFCYFNNIAVAAQYLLRRHGQERVAIFDFDVHHGNGTQHLFEDRPEIFYVSVHQSPLYPGTGDAWETGTGAGEGATLNLPLGPGADDARYRGVIEDEVLPALRHFAPNVLLVSAGFDSWRLDPVGGMSVTADGFAAWGELIGRLAGEVCDGRVLSVLEGGYDVEMLPRLVDAYLGGLAR